MPNGVFQIPIPQNEPIYSYAPGSPERAELKRALEEARSRQIEIPMIINGKPVLTDKKMAIHPPHDLGHTLGYYFKGGKEVVEDAIAAALDARHAWQAMSWEQRASIFLKAADLLAGPYRQRMNAATMLGQSKNPFQSEIDAVCELVDFLRFNVYYMQEIYELQPESVDGLWNRMDYRPLEGFILAVSPFNFTSIGGNLPTAPAMLGNTVVWKPAHTQIYSAHVFMEILLEAGLPDGVINMVFTEGAVTGNTCLEHPDFAGLHFTGSYGTFAYLWKKIGANLDSYKVFPRIVGETGGKDFIVVHPSADVEAVATAMVRGAFEYQGQKCSAASRAYIPQSLWPAIKELLIHDLKEIKVGPVEDFSNFMNAVIDEHAFKNITSYIDRAKSDGQEILFGGHYDSSKGYFIDPTVVVVNDPKYVTMEEEIFGPVLSVYVYPDAEWKETLKLVDETSPYGLTGAVFARSRDAIIEAKEYLYQAAGNFYINDKPTGAVVNQQPFGGARKSGTNDKAGSMWNLIRWVSPRSMKETFDPPKDFRYPFMEED